MSFKGLEAVLAEGRGIERAFQCHMHDDRHASASVNVQTGVWICYACDARGKVDDFIPNPEHVVRSLSGDDRPRIYAEEWLDLFDAYDGSAYWIERLGVATATHFRCGVHPVTGAPTYPLRTPMGAVLGVVQRQMNADPKYLYPYGARTSTTLFSSNNRVTRARVVILVEGAPDVMALHSSSLPDGWQALGTFGAGLHAPQVQELTDVNPSLIVLGFDADDAGRSAAERAVIQCDNLAPVVSVDWSTVIGSKGTPAKDADEVPPAERIGLIAEAIHHHEGKIN